MFLAAKPSEPITHHMWLSEVYESNSVMAKRKFKTLLHPIVVLYLNSFSAYFKSESGKGSFHEVGLHNAQSGWLATEANAPPQSDGSNKVQAPTSPTEYRSHQYGSTVLPHLYTLLAW
jgi:hypothetical protein